MNRNTKMEAPAIGIDLGTTNSCVAVVKGGQVEIIPNTQGNRITPSCVAFTEEARLIGDPAKEQLARNPNNTVYEVKRLIGKNFADSDVKNLLPYLSFQVIKDDESDGPSVQVEHKGRTEEYLPEQISSIILTSMKELAEERHGTIIKKAVVTVPAYFNQAQRRATYDAAKLAGFEDCDIISEPTAAAFAYRLNTENQEKNFLVYDLGGGTFDVSIVQTMRGKIEVKATDGNPHLGGLDFDNRLVQFALKDIRENFDTDLSDNKEAVTRLKLACERMKKQLSSSPTAYIEMDYKNLSYNKKITRAFFENECRDLFDETMEIVKKCITDAKMSKDDIEDVLLVGGSTRICIVQEMIKEYFGSCRLNKSINPDESVAAGAAVYAAVKFGNAAQSHTVGNIALRDVIPLSLGIMVRGGLMSTVLEKNTNIPQTKTNPYRCVYDYQEVVDICVYEGDRSQTKDNFFINEFKFDVTPLPLGEGGHLVTFHMDNNGILEVTAKDEHSGHEERLVIDKKKGRLSNEKIEKMIRDAQLHKAEDEVQRAKIEARNKLESYTLTTKSKFTRDQSVSEEDKDWVLEKCSESIQWLAENQDADKDQYEEQLSILMDDCDLS